MSKSMIHVCSPVMDLTTPDVWRAFSVTDWDVSEIYEKMYEAGIPLEAQRVGSLLNFCATKNIASIKTLEPDMYARINARFNNIEFMSQFSKSGYYKVGKPKDCDWNGRNHIKAGVSLEDVKKISDEYEEILIKFNVPYTRNKNDEFVFPKKDNIRMMKPIHPFKDLIESANMNEVIMDDETKLKIAKLNKIHTSWRDYCLYFLNNNSEPVRSIWREKMITSILSWKYGSGSVPDSTYDALEILSDLPGDFVFSITDDHWDKDDFKTFGRLNISGKIILSISHYPQESLEKECLMCIENIVENKNKDYVLMSPKLRELFDIWNKQNGKSITPLDAQKNFFGKEEKKEFSVVEPVPEEFSNKYWGNVVKGARIWFREQIHSTSSWKRFVIAIMKNDISLKYLGFAQTSSERLVRARAMQAFSDKIEEKEKARREAERLVKQIEAENNNN